MKKLIKPLALALAIVIVITMLFSITVFALDDSSAHHAVWTSKDNKDSITYKGVEYKKLPINYQAIYKLTDSGENELFVTNNNALAEFISILGMGMILSHDGNFITTSFSNISDSYETYFGVNTDKKDLNNIEYINLVYCKADIYDDVMKYISKGLEFTDYYYLYAADSEDSTSYGNEITFLNKEEIAAINQVISNTTPLDNYTVDLEKCDYISLRNTDTNHYFKNEDRCVVAQDENGKFFVMPLSNEDGHYTHYEVPDSMNEIFTKIIAYEQL